MGSGEGAMPPVPNFFPKFYAEIDLGLMYFEQIFHLF